MFRLISLMVIYYLIEIYASNPGIVSLPLAFYLKDTLNFSSEDLARFQGIALIPWMIKPIWGLLADSFPIFGYQTKGYFVICYSIALIIFLYLSLVTSYTTNILIISATLVSTCIAFSDVLVDKLMVVEGRARNKTAILQAAQWTALGLGGAIMYCFSGWIAKNTTLSFAFLISAIVPLVGLLATFLLLPESKVNRGNISIKKSMSLLWVSIKSYEFIGIIGFIAFLGFSPTPPLLFYESDVLKFSKDLLGILSAASLLGVGFGAIVFGSLAQKVSQSILLNLIIVISAISTLSLIFMNDNISAISVHLFNGFTNTISLLGVLEIAAQACPSKVEGTTYALLVSISNFALAFGSILGGWLYDSGIAFSTLVIISAVFTSLCWFLIPIFKLKKV